MLYRGECRAVHDSNNGKIFPKNLNGEKEVVERMDGQFSLDGRFTLGPTEANRVAAHQIETGLYGGCSVSTTRSHDEAKRFALYADNQGVIYWIDDSEFESHGVLAIEPENPDIAKEQEVTIRAADGGEIPAALVVHVEFVERS
ncbi:hypothetical protein FHJ31_22180 [Pseudomonas sp. Fig-3]|uniref:hypothetical protein n=1 Tax=Pseudomonas TaxID=286 RepID=UPI001112C4E0|nr:MULTISPECIES: hypothetical protein [unclassified Pseudomonas]TNB80126.1 hypothetical protein FHJ31_22180 [Pseudomonas sp. Fig-3]WNZ80378.1 hypothetical protein QOM08_09915 [Pseudomonas sp. P105]